jgi:hypothetical protein
MDLAQIPNVDAPFATEIIMSPEVAVRDALVNDLRSYSLHVETEPVIGSAKPDLLVSDDHGNAYVIEIKMAQGGAHFGSVAQTAAFRTAAASALTQGANVRAILVLLGDEAHELDATGRDYGVDVVGSSSLDPHHVTEVVRETIRLESRRSAGV